MARARAKLRAIAQPIEVRFFLSEHLPLETRRLGLPERVERLVGGRADIFAREVFDQECAAILTLFHVVGLEAKSAQFGFHGIIVFAVVRRRRLPHELSLVEERTTGRLLEDAAGRAEDLRRGLVVGGVGGG